MRACQRQWTQGRRSARGPSRLVHEQVLVPVGDIYHGLADLVI